MIQRVEAIKQLVADGRYAIDEVAVAEAIVLRVTAPRLVPSPTSPTRLPVWPRRTRGVRRPLG